MSFLFPSSPKKVIPDVQLSFDSAIEIEHAKHIILAILVIGTGLVALAPMLKPTRAIYLPPVTQAERDYYIQKIHNYNQQVAQPNHTQEDHLHLADALANIGEREAATEAYLQAMSDHTVPNAH
ncbi:hypothetical protein [Leptolyngbya sp. FACHB-16]|uniref:hypothetical protein n=1 Tax=unclassified Leptolyngbya TaxID=2650499 RepID=UPI001687F3A5|nr:hypothetical protein [Leptolyngbya sp. FACHB-16]MBD2158136.1 hypothetical protein [Leptolyngbya sp. FACHB-16]